MFELDTERAFGQDGIVKRTYVRRVLATLVVLGAVVLAGPWHAGASAQPRAQRYVVQPGDTLWRIASNVKPGSDPRPAIDRIEQANGLFDGRIQTGQTLLIPSD